MSDVANQKKVLIYSTPTCVYCNAAKAFFKQHNIQYENYDVLTDLAKRKEMIDKSRQMGVPVIFVGDEMIIGFDQPKLSKLLEVK